MNLQGICRITKPEEGMLVTCTIRAKTEIKDGLFALLIVRDRSSHLSGKRFEDNYSIDMKI